MSYVCIDPDFAAVCDAATEVGDKSESEITRYLNGHKAVFGREVQRDVIHRGQDHRSLNRFPLIRADEVSTLTPH